MFSIEKVLPVPSKKTSIPRYCQERFLPVISSCLTEYDGTLFQSILRLYYRGVDKNYKTVLVTYKNHNIKEDRRLLNMYCKIIESSRKIINDLKTKNESDVKTFDGGKWLQKSLEAIGKITKWWKVTHVFKHVHKKWITDDLCSSFGCDHVSRTLHERYRYKIILERFISDKNIWLLIWYRKGRHEWIPKDVAYLIFKKL